MTSPSPAEQVAGKTESAPIPTANPLRDTTTLADATVIQPDGPLAPVPAANPFRTADASPSSNNAATPAGVPVPATNPFRVVGLVDDPGPLAPRTPGLLDALLGRVSSLTGIGVASTDDASSDVDAADADADPTAGDDAVASADASAADRDPLPEELANVVSDNADALELSVERGDTLMSLLTDRAGLDRGQASAAVDALRDVFDPRKLNIGQQVTLYIQPGGEDGPQLQALTLQPEIERMAIVMRGADESENLSFHSQEVKKPLSVALAGGSGTIDDSLLAAGNRAGIPDAILYQMIHGFSYGVDFQRDIQPGDHFDVLYERYETEDGTVAKPGNLLFAHLSVGGKEMSMYRYEQADGSVEYYDSKGRSLKKGLMRTPVDGARITSAFGSRVHPILGFTKMHKGIDFGASRGTPIYAAGNGTIEYIGRFSSYGNYIRIRHNSDLSTAYAHMNGFAKGLRKGDRVKQGAVIGYVGMTGRATGPHLHYEVLVDKKQVNPMSVDLPVMTVLEGKDLKRFIAMRDQLDQKFAALPEQGQQVAQTTN
jgi:murein DD-endopeptidase MepM/ murein hydrolase activator NlpD